MVLQYLGENLLITLWYSEIALDLVAQSELFVLCFPVLTRISIKKH